MSRRLLAAVATAALAVGLAACGDGGDGTVTEPPPEINAGSDGGGSSDGGGAGDGGGVGEAGGADAGGGDGTEVSDGGGSEEDGSTQAALEVPPPDPADFPGKDENTPEGAEQAFRYYIHVMVWARQGGEIVEFTQLFDEECESCRKIASDITEDHNSGTYWTSASTEDTGIENYDSSSYDIEIGYIYILSEHRERAKGSVVGAQQWTSIGGLDWKSGRWLVRDFALRETSHD